MEIGESPPSFWAIAGVATAAVPAAMVAASRLRTDVSMGSSLMIGVKNCCFVPPACRGSPSSLGRFPRYVGKVLFDAAPHKTKMRFVHKRPAALSVLCHIHRRDRAVCATLATTSRVSTMQLEGGPAFMFQALRQI